MIEFLSLYLYQQIEDTGEFCEKWTPENYKVLTRFAAA